MIRLFVALKIPDDVINEILSFRETIYPEYDRLKWESPEKIHLTLKFIGEVKVELLAQLKDRLGFIRNYESFNCSANKFGFFFRGKEPKILWAGLHVEERLIKLVQEINSTLEPLSIPAENRKFKAHLTLLRIKKPVGAEFIRVFESYDFPNIGFTADQAVMFESALLPGGSQYKEIEIYKLK